MGSSTSISNDCNQHKDDETPISETSQPTNPPSSSSTAFPVRKTKLESSSSDSNSQLAIIGDRNNEKGYSLIGNDSSFFSIRKPKDALAGMASGAKSLVKGVAGGAAGLITFPVIGAMNEGALGFAKGAATGLTTAVVMPVTGAAIAFYQIGRGIINTPSAVINQSGGKKWDRKTQEWIYPDYRLSTGIRIFIEQPNPWKILLDENKRQTSSETRDEILVVDKTYYDILEVQPSASSHEIKAQYYKLALQYHPDKNPDQEEAKAKFQELGIAYQVLSNEESRAEYNKSGQTNSIDKSSINYNEIFTVLFGSEQLEPFTGKTNTVTWLEHFGSSDPDLLNEFFQFETKKRYFLIAVHLRELINPYVNNEISKDEWRSNMTDLASTLCSSSFGFTLIDAIGWTYVNSATQFLGQLDTFLGYGATYAKLRARFRNYGNKMSTARKLISILGNSNKAAKNKSSSSTSEKKNSSTTSSQDDSHHSNNENDLHESSDFSDSDLDQEMPLNFSKDFKNKDHPSASQNENYFTTENFLNPFPSYSNNFLKNMDGFNKSNLNFKKETPTSKEKKESSKPLSSESSQGKWRLKNSFFKRRSSQKNLNDRVNNNGKHKSTSKQTPQTPNVTKDKKKNLASSNNTKNDPSENHNLESDISLLPKLLEMLLSVLLDDIETASKKSVKRLLRDTDVDIPTQRLRSEALIELGDIFQISAKNWVSMNKHKMKPRIDPNSAMDMIQNAFIKAAQKQNEKEERESNH